eukprot:TRINITY_DN1412_c0_g1_i4.p1 TRINITY_DN1412_c0_g1~~TRINITY_DN1412_c0_g1_i4.p1  ORF type:complete len:867 (-),score=182.03 TRINITY_DN1412_c0_g1_i4:1507-4107(-)
MAKYFSTTKKGEIHELKRDLDSQNEKTKKEAVKKVIAAMTVGKDVSVLFPDVVKCIRTTNLELKKLVYLYIMNYAKSKPDLAILSVNAFVHDAQHANPLVRALAVRTMGCIRVDKITEYLCSPLRECLKDPDPYVRKTAAVCVAKVWDINPDLVDTQGFLEELRNLLSDSNPMVVANAVAALTEIDSTSKDEIFQLTAATVNKLLIALNECTEWGQIFILHALSSFTPRKASEAESIAERVAPRLAHANSAVVLSTIRVLMRLLEFITSDALVKALAAKMTPPLVTLVNREPEISYVALRNINLIVQKRRSLLRGEMKVFFCKYNDPIYVKMEKLEIMIMLVNERAIDSVLMELKEYAQEVDVEFVRKSVRAIGRCAIKLESAAERCVQVLLELIQTKVNYVVQEAIVVIKDIFRKYPNKYEMIIATLCENLDTLDEPEAKASMIWIIGEYAERIENAGELLESFLDNFQDEPSSVQLQLLTASVKLFLKRPKKAQALVTKALNLATKETGNPDLRDRGFVYWRLLSKDPEAAKKVVLSSKPLISDDSTLLEPSLLDELISHMSTLASVYHKPPSSFVANYHKKELEAAPARKKSSKRKKDEVEEMEGSSTKSVSLIDLGGPSSSGSGNSGVFIQNTAMPVVISAEEGKGLELKGKFSRVNGNVVFLLTLTNKTSIPMSEFMLQFDKNLYRLRPNNVALPCSVLPANGTVDLTVALNNGGEPDASSADIRIALKNNVGVYYGTTDCPVYVFFTEDGQLGKKEYLALWKQIGDSQEHSSNSTRSEPNRNTATLINALKSHNLFLIAKRNPDGDDILYLSAKVVPPGAAVLVEITCYSDSAGSQCCIRTPSPGLVPFVDYAVKKLLAS